MKIKTTQKTDATIPLASTADVAFLLIIFFMLTSTMVKESGIELTLPQAKKTEQKKMREKSITISKKGQYYFNGVPMSPEAIEQSLGESLKDAKGDEARSVTIKADKSIEWQTVVTAIDIVNRLDGILVLIMEEEGSGAATPSGPVTATSQ